MEKKKQIIIYLVIAVVIIIGVIFYNYKSPNNTNLDDSQIIADNKIEEEIKDVVDGLDKPKVLQDVVQDIQISEDINIPTAPVPDLNASVQFTSEYPLNVKKNISDEIERLRWELKKDSYNFQNWIGLGLQMKIAGDNEKARDAWEYASLIRPQNSLSFNNLGDLYHYYLRDYKKAEENLLISLKNNPNNTSTYRNLFDLYKNSYQQDTDKAEKILLSGIVIFPDNTDLIVPLAMYYKERGDKTNAEKYYNLAIKSAENKNNTNLAELLRQDLKEL